MSVNIINPHRFGAPAAFVPTDISGLELWLDADVSDFTLTGSLVDQWNDASGNGRHFEAPSDSERPTKTTVGGLEVVDFDGTDEVLRWDGTPFAIDSGFTILLVMAHQAFSSTGNTYFSITDDTVNGSADNIAIACRYQGDSSSPDWDINIVNDGTNPGNLTQDMGQALGTTQLWALIRGGGGTATMTNNNNTPTEVTDTYSDEPPDINFMAVAERLAEIPIGNHADVQVRAVLLYSQEITGGDLTDLVAWADDKIV